MAVAGSNRRATVEESVHQLACEFRDRAHAFSAEMAARLLHAISELGGDPNALDECRNSCEANLASAFSLLADGADTSRMAAPPAALEYARSLARRNVSVAALLRAYRSRRCSQATSSAHGHSRCASWAGWPRRSRASPVCARPSACTYRRGEAISGPRSCWTFIRTPLPTGSVAPRSCGGVPPTIVAPSWRPRCFWLTASATRSWPARLSRRAAARARRPGSSGRRHAPGRSHSRCSCR